MSNLNSAMKLVKDARKSDGRKIESKFLDLCKAVQQTILRLQELETECKAKKQ